MKKRQFAFLVGIVVLVGLLSFTGCATKKFVTGEIATIDKKVTGVETAVEENQKRIREHDERLASIGSLITQHDNQFKEVDGKIDEVRKVAQGHLLFKETLRSSDAKFKFDSFALSPEAQAALDKLVETLIAQDRGVYIEIQGHTDSTGEEGYNLILGKKRADAVVDYLYKKHHVPLHRMQAVSWGSSAPVGDNKTTEGRAQNRRVEVLVYE